MKKIHKIKKFFQLNEKNIKKIKFFQLNKKFMKYNTLKRELTSLKNINDNYPKYIITLDYDILKNAL